MSVCNPVLQRYLAGSDFWLWLRPLFDQPFPGRNEDMARLPEGCQPYRLWLGIVLRLLAQSVSLGDLVLLLCLCTMCFR